MKKVICIITIFINIGCANPQSKEVPNRLKNIENLTVYTADEEPANDITFTKEQAFGDTKEVLTGRINDVAVDKTGRVYIADGDQFTIKVYNANGQFLSRLGRKGQGPGEFTNILNVQTAQHKLFAYDNSQQRIITFSTDSLKYQCTINIAANRSNFSSIIDANLGTYFVKNNGTFLMEFYKTTFPEGKKDWNRVERTSLYYQLDNKGRISSKKFFELKSGTRVFVPVGGYTVGRSTGLYPKLLMAVSQKNALYVVWSGDFLIKIYSPDGRYKRAIYYSYERVPLTEKSASKAGTPGFILKGFDLMNLPKHWPAINSMLSDDQNHLWLSTIIKDQSVYKWWVLSNEGKLIARFTWPRSKEIKLVKNGKLYTLEEDSETNVNSIVRYKFDLTVH